MTTTTGSKELMRNVNRSLILNAIRSQGTVGRADIARLTGLSPATVTGISGTLIDEGLVFEKRAGDSSGGRPPILLAINPEGGYVVGAKLMEDHVIGALTDLESCVIAKDAQSFAGRTPADAVAALLALVDDLLAQGGIPRNRLLGVGVGLAGIVEPVTGVVRQSPFFGWHDVPLRDLLAQRLNAAVTIDNDVKTLTQAESLYGSGQGQDNFLTMTLGRGIGLGIVLRGQLYRGAGGGAGEFGHTVIDPDGPACDCGKRGCLETFAADPALMRMAAEESGAGRLPEVSCADDLLELARSGHDVAAAIFARAGNVLGQAVANLVNLFNPGRILVSGEGARYGEYVFGPMRDALSRHALPALLADLDLRIEPWGDDMWARGAASLVLSRLFESPLGQTGSVSSISR